MRITKALSTDNNPIDQIEGSPVFAKNIIRTKKINSIYNEDGFLLKKSLTGNIIGKCEIEDSMVVIFSINDTYSNIGIYYKESNIYREIVSREDLGFNIEYPIYCKYDRNYNGELIIIFRDILNTPKLINLDTYESAFTIEDLLLFPNYITPVINKSLIEFGGSLNTGVYYISGFYEQEDGTETSLFNFSQPLIIVRSKKTDGYDKYVGSESGINSNKSININYTELDTKYDYITPCICEKINGVLRFYKFTKQKIISNSLSFLYNGENRKYEITTDQAITKNPSYDSFKALEIHNNALYLSNLKQADRIDFQSYANDIIVNYTTTLVDVTLLTDSTDKSGAKTSADKGFSHGEVAALYIHLELNDGTITEGYHIPGRASISNDLLTSSNAIIGTEKKFQLDDTTNSVVGKNMGYWENSNEEYPDTPEYVKARLNGVKVRHHVFPTIAKCKTIHYSGDNLYGITKIDRLGIQVSNVVIPDNIKSKVKRWFISYAKRDFSSSTNLGTDILLYAAKDNPDEDTEDNNINMITTSGGNWALNSAQGGGGAWSDMLVNEEYIRLHSFEMLLSNPSISPTHIRTELKLVKGNLNSPFQEDGKSGGYLRRSGSGSGFDTDKITSVVIDYTDNQNVISTVASNIKKISEFKYLANATKNGDIYNVKGEDCGFAKITNATGLLTFSTLTYDSPNSSPRLPFLGADDEQTFLITICQYKENMYLGFDSQLLVKTEGFALAENTSSSFLGGDVFQGTTSFITTAPMSAEDFEISSPKINGIKIFRNVISESIHNSSLRYSEDGNIDSYFYPNNDPDRFVDILDLNKPKVIKYNEDYTSIQNINFLESYSIYRKSNTNFPNLIIRSLIQLEDSTKIAYRTFRTTDYYEMEKTKGEVINLVSFGETLLIHTTNTLYQTVSSVSLETQTESVTIGSGNIFRVEPREQLSDNRGYAGINSPFDTLKTRFGYFIISARERKIFLFNGKLNDLTFGFRQFFRDNLINTGVNPFNYDGYAIGYDERYNRFLITSKFKDLTNYTNYKGTYIDADWFTLNTGDIVYRNSRFQIYDSGDFLENTNYIDKSMTFSYYPELSLYEGAQGGIGSFHDYYPNFYLTFSNTLLAANNNLLYELNKGDKGKYFNSVKSSFVDVVINLSNKDTKLLNSISWISEIENINGINFPNKTLTHISIWGIDSTSGRISLIPKSAFIQSESNVFNSQGTWNFNNFYNQLINLDSNFIGDIYSNFVIDSSKIKVYPWHERKNLIGKYFIIRLEYDNIENNSLYLQEVDFNLNKSIR